MPLHIFFSPSRFSFFVWVEFKKIILEKLDNHFIDAYICKK